MGCLVGIFAAPVMFLKWCFTNGLKGWIVLGVVAVVLIIGFMVVKSAWTTSDINPAQIKPSATAKAPTATVQTGIPPIHQAPYMVKTISRMYYAKEAKQVKGMTTLTTYWELIGTEWKPQKQVLELPESEYGKVTVSKRRS